MKSNNGTQRKKYSRGTRLTFEVLHQICVWADCEKRDQLLRVNSPTPLPLYLTYAPAFGVLHAVVKEADDPQLMRFNVIPVLAAEAAPDDIQKADLFSLDCTRLTMDSHTGFHGLWISSQRELVRRRW